MKPTFTLRQKIFKKYYYFKLCYGRANSYLTVPLNLFQFYVMATLWVKFILNVQTGLILNLGFTAFFIIFMYIGYTDVKRGINQEEIAFGNQFNPDLMEIKKNVKK